MASIQIRRSKRTFLLVVLDEDTDRFAIEGPMADDQPWVSEILRAQRAGRRITCWAVDANADELDSDGSGATHLSGRTRWPKGSILTPEPGDRRALPARNAGQRRSGASFRR